MEVMNNTPFLAFTRIALNNWHYISRKVLSLNREINFFTGHSGSGKSTVIDAMQLVLYANTDGRGFFNKAAADDSDRSLIEYLRGMVNIGENNQFSYLRNQNFSSTIVLEMQLTGTENFQCIGIVFDVNTASNEVSRRFFWHKGSLWENEYRTASRPMSISEVEQYLRENYSKEDYFSTSHNERFRRILYDSYLGGLDSEKFPLLFKRAIPFRMNIRLEDFVKEYICTEQNIHIEDMQESVMQYGRMQKKIEDTCEEIRQLKAMKEAFNEYDLLREKQEKYSWFVKKLDLLDTRAKIRMFSDKIDQGKEDLDRLGEAKRSVERQIADLTKDSDELLKRIASTGYEELKEQLSSLNALCEQLGHSEAKWQKTLNALKKWEEEEIVSNQTLWDIEEFENRSIDKAALRRLKASLSSMEADTEKLRQETVSQINELKKAEKLKKLELEQLKAGNKAYPGYLEEARGFLQRRLLEETGKSVDVYILADLLDIRDDQWRNAVEGYLGGNKLNLVVAPKYAKIALGIYRELDKKKFWNIAVLDTERASEYSNEALKDSLAEEVSVREAYLKPYISLLLGKVIKCTSIEELQKNAIGITPDCLLYHTFRLQYINPENYTRLAYIGKDSMRKRVKLLDKELEETAKKRAPLEETLADCKRILSLETLKEETDEYFQWLSDMDARQEKLKEKEKLSERMETLRQKDVKQLEADRKAVLELTDGKKRERDAIQEQTLNKKNELERFSQTIIKLETEAAGQGRDVPENEEHERELNAYLADKDHPRFDQEKEAYQSKCQILEQKSTQAKEHLMGLRSEYIRLYPGRNVPVSSSDNAAYDKILDRLACDDLEIYREQAGKQAKAAVEHFKDDFMYKVRSAIKDAMLRKDELNRIISRLDFGKDKYQFVISKCKGTDGRFYDMFMDESLEIDPGSLSGGMDNQLNLFSMEHENRYGDLINELISIFIPPENATAAQLEEARRNMEKYADYRTYLSFDMQQLIKNDDEVIRIGLSRMIRKNSGGEGQNPLYVALLASFAQAYHIGHSPAVRQRPSIRLVILDEAFSKMDAEKVASCIELIRGLGFQAIISATNDKIQNYVENVDKTFVFANPSKKSISIQAFEKDRMKDLAAEVDNEA